LEAGFLRGSGGGGEGGKGLGAVGPGWQGVDVQAGVALPAVGVEQGVGFGDAFSGGGDEPEAGVLGERDVRADPA
jgi:hypothetical protein